MVARIGVTIAVTGMTSLIDLVSLLPMPILLMLLRGLRRHCAATDHLWRLQDSPARQCLAKGLLVIVRSALAALLTPRVALTPATPTATAIATLPSIVAPCTASSSIAP